VMGNSSFDLSFAQTQDIAQDFRFAPACANLRAENEGYFLRVTRE